MSDLMIDIETLGTKPGCVVLSIGAAEFADGEILSKYQVHIDPEDSVKHGLTIDPRTVMWWLDQDKAAQQAITKATVLPLENALDDFSASYNWKSIDRIWCNGAAFDFPILSAAFAACGMKAPWPYWAEMDMRTIKGLVGKKNWAKFTVKPAVAHDGMEDAIAQAKTLMAVLDKHEVMKWAA